MVRRLVCYLLCNMVNMNYYPRGTALAGAGLTPGAGRLPSRHSAAALFSLLVASLLAGGSAEAATIDAKSGLLGDVTVAINAAVDGDTVAIPAGTVQWTSSLTINKAITLQGKGMGLTIIRDGVPLGAKPQSLITWTLVAGKMSRMTGIEFQAGKRSANTFYGTVLLSGSNADTRRIRVDHCKFNALNAFGIQIEGALGVIDHCTFLASTVAIYGFHRSYNGGSYGDGSWAAPTQLGSDQFIFIEDCTITYLGAGHYTMLDGFGGLRYVFRHNTVNKGSLEGHGTESGQRNRGTRAWEIYNNNFVGNDNGQIVSYNRSGVGVIHDNTITGYHQSNTPFHLENFRAVASFPPWAADNASPGGADGRNPWDVNVAGGPFLSATATSGTGGGTLGGTVTVAGANWTPNQWVGYTVIRTADNRFAEITSNTAKTISFCDAGTINVVPTFSNGDAFTLWKVDQALDNVGRAGGSLISGDTPSRPAGWNNQITEACYEWNNSREGGVAVHFTATMNTIRLGEHFIDNTPKPGYTPYTYPHPLITGGVVASPPAPANLRVLSGP